VQTDILQTKQLAIGEQSLQRVLLSLQPQPTHALLPTRILMPHSEVQSAQSCLLQHWHWAFFTDTPSYPRSVALHMPHLHIHPYMTRLDVTPKG